MPSTDPNVRSISCPGCGARNEFPASASGRRGSCAQCGTTFVVPAPSDAPVPAESSPKPQRETNSEPEPKYVGVECRVCQTRMYGRLDQVGKKVKCPDCGALTVIPPPPPPKPMNMPAALDGEQYELWDADAQPLPSELIAHQPNYIAVTCRNCATLMYAAEKQVGQTIECPDCGTQHVAPAPPKLKPKVSVVARDADTPKLDRAAHPGERPPVTLTSTRKMVYEELQEAEYARALEKSRRTGKPMEVDARGRAIMPRWPLLTGVLPFPFSHGVPVRWFALSVGFIGALSILLSGLELAMSGGMGAIAGMCFFAIGCIATMLCAAVAASALLAIVTESSEGNREVQYWPGIHDWFGDLLLLGVAGMVSAIPGWLIARFVAVDDVQIGLCIGGGVLVCLPIVIMSQLDINSPWGVVSGRVLGSLATCPFSWLLFYLEIALLAAACGGVTFFVAGQNPESAVWLVPMYFLALLLFARLLGRLGWRLAEAMPVRE